jgi:hypothetical protein
MTAPIMLTVIIIVAAASPIRAILEEVVFWILLDGSLSTIQNKTSMVYKRLMRLFSVLLPSIGKIILISL